MGIMNHYLFLQMRSRYPWKFFAKPIIKSFEFYSFETNREAEVISFERFYIWFQTVEKNMVLPLFIFSLLSQQSLPKDLFSIMLVSLMSFRISRTAYSQPQQLYVPLTLTGFFTYFKYGYFFATNTVQTEGLSSVLITLFVFFICWEKFQELSLKLDFIICYVAPWQISWGSAFHAFAQPFSLPHSGFMLAQALFSSLISAPLNPFLGSSFFLMSYVRF